MYYPFLRGRQNELLALRELLENKPLNHVTPVIEPVKVSSTLLSTLESYEKSRSEIFIVLNPQVGSFCHEMDEALEFKTKFKTIIEGSQFIIPTFYLNEGINDAMRQYKYEDFCCIVNKDYADDFEQVFQDNRPRLTFVEDSSKRKIREKKILLADRFKLKERNSDYAENSDEFFSNDHLFYKQESFEGFSDYSIVGNVYKVKGFAPRVVAIHIAYENKSKNGDIWIKHFTSKDDGTIDDTPRKFYDAAKCLQEWCDENKPLKTFGLNKILAEYGNEHYPGLGIIKKLSIMHHLELMNSILKKQK